MSALTESAAWQALSRHHAQVKDVHMRDLFAQDSDRFSRFSLRLEDLLFDFSKNRVTAETMALLCDLARQADLEGWRDRMFAGEKINVTEGRAVLHTALRNRSNRPIAVDGQDVMPEVNQVLGKMRTFSEAVRSGAWKGYTGKPINAVVNIGIGGSDLGPQMVTQALTHYTKRDLQTYFVSNVDGTDIAETLRRLDAEDGQTDTERSELEAIAEDTTHNERRAMAAERDATDRFIAAWLSDRVGAEFEGRIAGVTRFGCFVKLNETGADGLCPISRLGSEYFMHDESAHALVGQQTGARYRLGMSVTVRLIEATPVTGGLVFDILTPPESGKPPKGRSGRRDQSASRRRSGPRKSHGRRRR